MVCEKCGGTVRDTAKFCPWCGVKLTAVPVPQEPTPEIQDPVPEPHGSEYETAKPEIIPETAAEIPQKSEIPRKKNFRKTSRN